MTDNVPLVKQESKGALVSASGADRLLSQIRPEWQAKGLIQRTKRLLPVDPSSACQRLLNATIHDLRQKILIAGIDLAQEAAKRFKLPSITRPEDVSENYTPSKVIDLAYRIGILSRPEWRKIKRCYEIRGDLEHEDDQYEADIDDILYIFKNCVEIVLSKDPIELIRIDDIKDIIEDPTSPVITSEILEEYEHAPDTRQKDIMEHLINVALNSKKPDIVRMNSMEVLRQFSHVTKNRVLVEIGSWLQERTKRKSLNLVMAKVAYAAGVLPYLKQRKLVDFFNNLHMNLERIGYHWRKFDAHREPLENLDDVGGLLFCPKEPRKKLVLWMILCYLGEPGGYGVWGRNREVFYSDTAAPIIKKMFSEAKSKIKEDFLEAIKDNKVQAAITHQAISRRLEALRDLIEE